MTTANEATSNLTSAAALARLIGFQAFSSGVTSTNGPAPGHRGPERLVKSALGTALRRARWMIFWERLWPALAALATAAGLFLTVSWLGLWLWLPPLGRAAGVVAFVITAIAAAVPFLFVRVPAVAEGLRRLDHGSGLRHRPATAIVDELAVTPSDSYSLALWNAHVARTLAAARTFKAGWPSPRVAARDPYALRGLVLIACIATFVAAGGERWKRIAAAFDWQGVRSLRCRPRSGTTAAASPARRSR
jgi:hypothetical protein